MKHEDGSIELGSVVVLFFFSTLLAGSILLLSSNMTYIARSNEHIRVQNEADALLLEITTAFQELKQYEYDAYTNMVLERLSEVYAEYGLVYEDISSGYHLDFLSDDDLKDSLLCKYLFVTENAAPFITWLETNGLSSDTSAWELFVKDTALESCVSYGWMHSSQINSFAYRAICKSFKTESPDLLYPLINTMPLMNVNAVNPECLLPLIMRPSFRIKEPEQKADALMTRLRDGPVKLSDIEICLGVPASNQIFTYLGTKTAFWHLAFRYNNSLSVEAVLAAIPEKVATGPLAIAEYKLIDRKFRYEW